MAPAISEAATAVRAIFQARSRAVAASNRIDVFLVAGSGFREALPELTDQVRFSMREIPHFPAPAVAGHGCEFIHGSRDGKRVLIATGRVHLYEGYSPDEVAFATRMVHHLGCRSVILTNAAGSVDPDYKPGMLVALSDQINLTGKNCETTEPGVSAAFTDMTDCYDPQWRKYVLDATGLHEGIYAGLTGPSYETRAEARMLRILGANLVGMSTVQECIAARALGMKVFGLSLVTNMAGGLGGPVNHEEVLAAGQQARKKITAALIAAIGMAQGEHSTA